MRAMLTKLTSFTPRLSARRISRAKEPVHIGAQETEQETGQKTEQDRTSPRSWTRNSMGTQHIDSTNFTVDRPDQSVLLHATTRLIVEMVELSDGTRRDDDPFFCRANSNFPTFDEVYGFLTKAYDQAGWSPEVNIIALVLLNRFCDTGVYPIAYHNWSKMMLVALCISQKMFDDDHLKNKDFPRLWRRLFPAECEDFTTKQLYGMETLFLSIIEWRTYVSRAVYVIFYFELRKLSREVGVVSGDVLTDERAQRLETRTATQRASCTIWKRDEQLPTRATVTIGALHRSAGLPGGTDNQLEDMVLTAIGAAVEELPSGIDTPDDEENESTRQRAEALRRHRRLSAAAA